LPIEQLRPIPAPGEGGPFEQGLDETVEWYPTHRDWWEPLRRRASLPRSDTVGQPG